MKLDARWRTEVRKREENRGERRNILEPKCVESGRNLSRVGDGAYNIIKIDPKYSYQLHFNRENIWKRET